MKMEGFLLHLDASGHVVSNEHEDHKGGNSSFSNPSYPSYRSNNPHLNNTETKKVK
jgi:hypothetical protein